MKNIITKTGYLFATSLIVFGCQVRIPSDETPDPSSYGEIEKIKITNGFPLNNEPWVVISDRANNNVFVNKDDSKSPKEINFLEPLLVVKHNSTKGLVKVAEYNPDALLKKISKKEVKTYGWIPEDQLLLWTNSIKNSENGFNIKATLTPNNSNILKNGENYLRNDSVIVYDSPNLTKETKKKLPIGQMVYIYKKAEDGKRFLLGKSPSVKIDSISGNIYGWVNSNLVTIWGDKSGLRVSPDYKIVGEGDLSINKISYSTESQTSFAVSDAADRKPLENIISRNILNPKTENEGKFFTNSLDYSKNFINNILGSPIYYPRYKEIIKKNKNLNVVFTIDASRDNEQNIAVAKTGIQDLSIKLGKIPYFRNVKFGVVLYKNNSCGENVVASELTADPDVIAKFIDQQLNLKKCDGYGGQPMQEGMQMAGKVLMSVKDETNLVILIGANSDFQNNMSGAISTLSAARARIIAYQTYSGTSESANNFVLASEKMVTNSGRNIADIEKERIADQAIVLNKNNYNLEQQDEGFYSLDYPKGSMWQGIVIFPKKGEFNSAALLSKSIDTIISQATFQNIELENSLTKYFKDRLANTNTTLKADFRNEYSDVPVPLPAETSLQFVKYNNPFLAKGTYSEDFKNYYPVVQKGILVSEQEYKQLRELYQEIYQETAPFSTNFSQSKAINKYIKVLKKYNLTTEKLTSSDFKDKSMAYSVAYSTGFDTSTEELLTKYNLAGWRKSDIMPLDGVRAYFSQFKILSDRLLENTNNVKIQIDQNGETYYWLSNYFAPLITPQESL